ncbi:hypothetical protein KEF85_06625 [Methylomonas paludis]|uniref:Uncharacterized protein n=1 Tax=Methylomonas paludis TaxID=1173101 RepID=A0A975MQH0_9GAMM|nr:hypothetical protein [Methylomonas paludis]QWF72117.1 hypothetical protein KEF85_06625 [Methylomonas paludis]
MAEPQIYPEADANPVISIIKGVDRDVERGEDMLMLGYALVLSAPIFAPIAPPKVLLPLMALAFIVSVCRARLNFNAIKAKLAATMAKRQGFDFAILNPLLEVFAEHPKFSLSDGFNPVKNLKRTFKSLLGALMINPFWMPIFYALGLQFAEEKHFYVLNQAVIKLEQKTGLLERRSD